MRRETSSGVRDFGAVRQPILLGFSIVLFVVAGSIAFDDVFPDKPSVDLIQKEYEEYWARNEIPFEVVSLTILRGRFVNEGSTRDVYTMLYRLECRATSDMDFERLYVPQRTNRDVHWEVRQQDGLVTAGDVIVLETEIGILEIERTRLDMPLRRGVVKPARCQPMN